MPPRRSAPDVEEARRPSGAHSHLWALPVAVRRADRVEVEGHHARRVRRVDQRVHAPAGQLARRSRATGRTSAVVLVTWLTSARRVRGVTASRIRLHGLVGDADGERDPDDDDAGAVAVGDVRGAR